MGKAESQSKFTPTSGLTSIETKITEINTKLDDLKGALNSVGTDKFHAKTEMLIQSEYDKNCTRDVNGRLTQIIITDGSRTKTIDINRDVNGRISFIDESVS